MGQKQEGGILERGQNSGKEGVVFLAILPWFWSSCRFLVISKRPRVLLIAVDQMLLPTFLC